VTTEQLTPKATDGPYLQQARQMMNVIRENNITESEINDEEEHYKELVEIVYNTEFNPRDIVGDDYEDLTDRSYGSNDVIGVSNSHGTHVAGIVGAVRNNGLGGNGVASSVKLMIIRVVPDGDERDKDVANGIRY